jgi:RNA polymerase sigma-70 factor (ECF subfamily)
MPVPDQLTKLLIAWTDGDERALGQIAPAILQELRRLAKRYMAGEREGHTLQATALVNAAFMRLIDWKNVRWQNRAHFIGVAAKLMRHVLVDYARNRRYAKRGAAAVKVTLDEALIVSKNKSPDLLALDDALLRLEKLSERKCKVVELRFFGGLTVEETAEVLKVSPNTVLNDWNFAKTWLRREIASKP